MVTLVHKNLTRQHLRRRPLRFFLTLLPDGVITSMRGLVGLEFSHESNGDSFDQKFEVAK